MSDRDRVLFICQHNSARSQMAETFLNDFGGEWFEAESAGFEQAPINQNVVEVMKELDYDLSNNSSDDVFDFFKEGRRYQYTITVCDASLAERCPIFPGLAVKGRLHWGFTDPSGLEGDRDSVLARTREIRDEIRAKIVEFIDEHKPTA